MYEHFFALCPGGSEGGKYSTVEVSGADAYHTGYTDPLYYLFYMPSPLLYPTLPYSTLPYPTLLYSTLLYSTYVHTVHTTTKREKEKKKRNVLGRLHTYIHTYILYTAAATAAAAATAGPAYDYDICRTYTVLVLYCAVRRYIYYSK